MVSSWGWRWTLDRGEGKPLGHVRMQGHAETSRRFSTLSSAGSSPFSNLSHLDSLPHCSSIQIHPTVESWPTNRLAPEKATTFFRDGARLRFFAFSERRVPSFPKHTLENFFAVASLPSLLVSYFASRRHSSPSFIRPRFQPSKVLLCHVADAEHEQLVAPVDPHAARNL